MEMAEITGITVEATVNATPEKVWHCWTAPRHITQWNSASDDWHTPQAKNDLRVGGKFLSRMEAKDGSWGFDFTGTYTAIETYQQIAYILDDGRKVRVIFTSQGDGTKVTETFEAEQTHSFHMQQTGWQSILDNFKRYVESMNKLKHLRFQISINCPAEKVYRTLQDEKQFTAWTTPFNPTSYFSGSWEKDAKILFLGKDKDGNTEGMVSKIAENIPHKFISIEHLGLVQNDVEVTSSPIVDGWAGALENYTLTEEEGQTLLSIYSDINQEHKFYFVQTWPKALQTLKEICEA